MYPIYILLIIVIIGLALYTSWAFENCEKQLGCLCVAFGFMGIITLAFLIALEGLL